ncbi:MAG: efflux RND transporter permease subunit [Proteobacteria bacterium]|nr:efflux RND transporter permease subunit [Pseudomonadota bacterium]
MRLAAVIAWSVRARHLVVTLTLLAACAGAVALRHAPLDALPNVAEPQVIVRTAYAGRTPEQVERDVAYPLATALASVPGAVAVRGVSMVGESFLYVICASDADAEATRTRVAQRLQEVQPRLPGGVTPTLGPDASGVGWVYQYALVARGAALSPGALGALQTTYLAPELQSLRGVAEVATVGGQAREFRVDIDPRRAFAHGLAPQAVGEAIVAANVSSGGGALDLGQRRVIVAADNRLRSLDELRAVPLLSEGGALRLDDVAQLSEGPAAAAGFTDLDGHGPAVGGIVIARQGENVLDVTTRVKARLAELARGLPDGVHLEPVYDRSTLVVDALGNLRARLLEEVAVVFAVCVLLLGSLRAAGAAALVLPAGLGVAALALAWQGVELNIMSLGGVAIALGAMTDAAIVMTENVTRRLAQRGAAESSLDAITRAAVEVGPALFWSLLLITLSFLPVLLFGGREGRLFAPLALTKTWLMAVACLLGVTLTPALLALLVRDGDDEARSAWLRRLQDAYRALLEATLARPRTLALLAVLALLSVLWPLSRMGAEFMPPLDEGDLLYMPTTAPGMTATHVREVLRRTDALIAELPEVESVFGKAGRADTATDPAPLAMLETTIRLKPREAWRPGKTSADLIAELDEKLRLPGLLNSWGYPIRTRIAMLASGVKTPLGLRISGPDSHTTEKAAIAAAAALGELPEVRSAIASRAGQGEYLDLRLDRARAAALGIDAAALGRYAELLTGAEAVSTVNGEGAERIAVTLRIAPSLRASLAELRELPLVTANGAVPLADVATLTRRHGPSEILSEGGRPVSYVYVNVARGDAARVMAAAAPRLATLGLPGGVSIAWVGDHQDYASAMQRLALIAPLVALAVVAMLYAVFHDMARVALILFTLPFALVGGLWLVHLLDFQFSVAVAVGLIALAGVAAEFSVVMTLYLDNAVREAGMALDAGAWRRAVLAGAVQRLRPKLMTVTVISASLLPVMLSNAVGCDVMQRIAAPMLGGMLSAPLVSMLLLPVIYHRVLRGGTAPAAAPRAAGSLAASADSAPDPAG